MTKRKKNIKSIKKRGNKNKVFTYEDAHDCICDNVYTCNKCRFKKYRYRDEHDGIRCTIDNGWDRNEKYINKEDLNFNDKDYDKLIRILMEYKLMNGKN